MAKKITEDASLLGRPYPRSPAVVTVHSRGRSNALAVGAYCHMSDEPPLYGIAISPKRFSYELICESGEFGINFFPLEAAELILALGDLSGRDVDKFTKLNIAIDKPVKISAPLLADAYVSYECKIVDRMNIGDHVWFVGKILAAHYREEVFTDKMALDLDKIKPALYIKRNLFLTADKLTLKRVKGPDK
ncbi:MAG: flavin reductase family protein [Dehalococcoidia bacterium]|nr:flavin reductase family protein [Dehalococcoidia bacterium]